VEALQKVLQCAPVASKSQAVKVSFGVLLYFVVVSYWSFIFKVTSLWSGRNV